jgi:hypothetical protein
MNLDLTDEESAALGAALLRRTIDAAATRYRRASARCRPSWISSSRRRCASRCRR